MKRSQKQQDMSKVSATALVRAYRAGEITLEELRDEFVRRDWNKPSWWREREAMTDAQRYIMAEDMAWNYREAGTWGEVEALYLGGELSDEEYGVLVDAVDAKNGVDTSVE